MLELELIFLSRSVVFSSSRSTLQSILGASVAQLRQLTAPWGSPAPGASLNKNPSVLLWFSIPPVYSVS